MSFQHHLPSKALFIFLRSRMPRPPLITGLVMVLHLTKVYSRRNDQLLHSAIMVLIISAKNACKNGWFSIQDTEELIHMANELFNSFCMSVCAPDAGNSVEVILKTISMFCPQLKFCGLVISFEAKCGYDILMSDFHVERKLDPEQKIRLLVVQRDSLEASSCLINPQHVSILVNGKAVDRRTNFSMDPGPQIPTDITKLLKYGTNLVQSIGYFDGNYIIAIAIVSNISLPHASKLDDYVHPVIPTSISDSDIMEGPSRITLNCPISFKRIKTPVKGQNCKHHQCFDYDSYMEINSRKPTWRCACCNSPTSFIDLRVDQNMVKILQETGEDMVDIFISADGSWKAFVENIESTNQMNNEKSAGKQDSCMEQEQCASSGIVDLTMEELDLSGFKINEIEEQKHFKDQSKSPVSQSFSESGSIPVLMGTEASHYHTRDSSPSVSLARTSAYSIGGPESLMHNVVLHAIQTDAISSANSRDPSPSVNLFNSALVYHQFAQGRQHTENIEAERSHAGALLLNSDDGVPQIPRYVLRNPTAIQAHPAPTQAPGSSQRLQTNLIDSNEIPNHLISSPYQRASSGTFVSSGLEPINNVMETELLSRSFNRASSSTHNHTSSQGQAHREPQGYVLNSSGLPTLNHMGYEASEENIIGVCAHRVPLEAPVHSQHPSQVHNQSRYPHTGPEVQQVSRFPTIHLPQALPKPSLQQARVDGSRNNSLSGWSSAQAVMTQAGAAMHLLANKAPIAPAGPTMNSTQTPPASLGGLTEPAEQNWQPTGRMRGSLTGNAYQNALSQYSVSPPAQSRKPT